MDMRCQIAVAEIEPVRTAERGEPFQSVKGFATESPALRGVDDASKRIGDDVEVGRDFQAVESNVVAGVDDDRQCAGMSLEAPTPPARAAMVFVFAADTIWRALILLGR